MSDTTYRYRSELPSRQHIGPLGLEVDPGEEFESPIELNHPQLVELKPKKPSKEAQE